jgi:hypothetical protein
MEEEVSKVIEIQPQVLSFLKNSGKKELVIYRTTEGSC